MNAIDLLHSTSSRLLKESQLCVSDAKFYSFLGKKLPDLLPSPDEIDVGNHITEVPQIIYRLDPDECAESLRILLGFVFGASRWYGIYNKVTHAFEIATEVAWNECTFCVKIQDVFTAYYCFEPDYEDNTCIVGRVHSRHFHSLQQSREDISRAIFFSRSIEHAKAAKVLLAQSKVLDEASTILSGVMQDNA